MKKLHTSKILSTILAIAIMLTSFVGTTLTMKVGAAEPDVEAFALPPSTTYFVSFNDGNDSSAGTSQATPWKTLTKVNSITFNPGDEILFDNQSTWIGQLAPKGSGQLGKPIVINKYGSGDRKPQILGNGLVHNDDTAVDPKPYNAAVFFYNQQYWEINNLEVTNFSEKKQTFDTYDGSSNVITKTNIIQSKYGILIVAKDSGTMRHMYVRDCNVHDVNSDKVDNRGAGIGRGGIIYIIRGNTVPTKWDDIIVENNKVGPNITHYGINFLSTWAGAIFPHESGVNGREIASTKYYSNNLIIRNNYCVDVGNAAISPSGYTNSVIEYNTSDICNSGTNGNVPIWWQEGDNTIVQYNEVFGTGAATSKEDSQAFDADLNARENIVQYNYTHDNPSGSYFECALGTVYTTHYRYNISANDGSGVNSHGGGAIVTIGGGSNNGGSKLYVYNNDMFIGPGEVGYIANSWDSGLVSGNFVYSNNLMYSSGNSRGWEGKMKAASVLTNNFYGGSDIEAIKHPSDISPVFEGAKTLEIPLLDGALIKTMEEATGWENINDFKRDSDSVLLNAGTNIPFNGGLDIYGNYVDPFGKPSIGAQEISAEVVVPEGKIILDFESELSQQPAVGQTVSVYNESYKGAKFTSSGWSAKNSGEYNTELFVNTSASDSRQNKIVIPAGYAIYGFTARASNSAKINISWDGKNKDFYLSSAKNSYVTGFTEVSSEDKEAYISVSSPYGVGNVYFDNIILSKTDTLVPRNVALNKPATQNGGENSADKGNDGNPGTFAGNTGTFPYVWEVDLKSVYDISSVEIEWIDLYTGEDGEGTNIAEDWKYKIESSVDGAVWSTVVDYSASSPYIDYTSSLVQTKDTTALLAKHFRVTVSGKPTQKSGAWAVLPEFRAIGVLAEEPLPNVALNKPATQSDGANSADKGNDGDITSLAGSTPTAPYTWEVDLGENYLLNKLEVQWEDLWTNKGQPGAVNDTEDWKYTIESSVDNVAWDMVVDYSESSPYTDPLTSAIQSEDTDSLDARYLKLTVTGKPTNRGGAWYALSEFRAFGVKKADTFKNVALGKAAKQNTGANSASMAVDGSMSTWAGNVNPSATPKYIWELDLGGKHLVNSVEIEWEDLWSGAGQTGTNQAEDWKYTIETSADEETWETIVDYSSSSPYIDPDTSQVQTKVLDSELETRYFKVTINGKPAQRPNGWYVLPEFRVMGKAIESGEETGDVNIDNLAYGKPAISNNESATNFAERMTDGLITSAWAGDNGDWAEIDLGLVYDIDRMELELKSGSSNDISLFVSNDKENWANYGDSNVINGDTISIAEAATGRYIRVAANEDDTGVISLEAFGKESDRSEKTVMILAPHPDDEALMGGGIIKRSLDNGDDVYVVIATLGDYNGISSGKNRMIETINAMQVLGIPSNKLIFLNYGDNGGLEQFSPQRFTDSALYQLFVANDENQVFTSRAGATQTYNGVNDSYHFINNGVQGDYTRANFLGDMQTAIEHAMPDEIYTTSRFDMHADHAVIGMFATESIQKIQKTDGSYKPTMYEALIHACSGDNLWPVRNDDAAGIKPFEKPKDLETMTALDWNKRVSITVPDVMKVTPFNINLKNESLKKYTSQYSSYIGSFAKYDEVFWVSEQNSVAHLAEITASSELANSDKSLDQSKEKAVDGIADGYSNSLAQGGKTSHNRFPFAEWVSDSEQENAWIQLNWETGYAIDSIKLYDRPNLDDQILAGTLHFSDGSIVSVGELPNDGRVLEVDFAEKTVNWIRFVVEEVSSSTTDVGLAEFEVFGDSQESPAEEASIEINRAEYNIEIGKSITIVPTLKPADVFDELIWAADSETISLGASSGTITGISEGIATITVSNKYNLFPTTFVVNVLEEVEIRLTVTPTVLTLNLGDDYQLEAKMIPEGIISGLLWDSVDESVATVSASGQVSAVGVGATTITVSSSDGAHTAKCFVTVKTDSVDPPVGPVDPPVGPVDPPVGPVDPPVGPVDPPVGPVDPPVGPVDPPVGPVDPPVGPVDPPVGPVDPPVGPVDPPVGSVDPPVGPVDPPVGPVDPPVTPPTGPSVVVVPPSGRGSSGRDPGTSTPDRSPNLPENKAVENSLSLTESKAAFNKAVANLPANATKIVVRIIGKTKVTGAVVSELQKQAREKGLPLQIVLDTVENNKVVTRLTITSPLTKREISTTVSLASAKSEAHKAIAEKYGDSAVIANFVQQTEFGGTVRIFIKLPAELLGKPLEFYRYNPTTKLYAVEKIEHVVDANGYVSFETSSAENLVICEKKI